MDYLWPCLVFAWLSYLWETYLQWRQRHVYHTVTRVPSELTSLLDQTTFDKARTYQLDKSSFSLVHNLYNQLELMVLLGVGAFPLAWRAAGWVTGYVGLGVEYELSQSMVFLELALIYSTLTGLPWNIYSTFVLEDCHGFNKQTPLFFLKDQAKSLALQMALIPPILLGLLYTIQAGGRAFFIYAWLFMAAVTILFVTVYQEFIAPLFDKFSPLPEGILHSAIRQLASSLKFPLGKIQVVEGSKRSAHSNAYLYGFWWNKVIVLFDTLLEPGLLESKDQEGGDRDGDREGERGKEEGEGGERGKGEGEETEKKENWEEGEGGEEKKGTDEERGNEGKVVKGCNQQEVLAVLAHELGHWSLSHTLKLLTFTQVNLLVSLVLFGFFMEQEDVYTSFGFHGTQPTIIGLILVFQLIFIPYNELMQFVLVQVIRRFEYQADSYARQLGRGGALGSALTKLNRDNLSFPVADPLYSAFHHTHPTFLERIRHLPKLE